MTAQRLLYRAFPFADWLPRMDARSLRADLTAGATVALVLVPQALAYAQLAGLPAHYGLYAAMLPAMIGALWGSSPQLATGPVALTSLLTAASLAPLAPAGGEAYIHGAVLLALLSGLFQLAFGLARLGLLVNLLSHPVLTGFLNAAAILIAVTQLPALLGVTSPQGQHIFAGFWYLLGHLHHASLLSAAFGIVAVALLVAFRRAAPRLPGVLLTVTALTCASWWTEYADRGGQVVGAIAGAAPGLGWPRLDWATTMELVPPAFVIAVVGFMEAMSSCKLAMLKTRRPWDENQELVGQGLAKIAAAAVGTFPVSGSFGRSALNLDAGARTGLASVIAALIVAACAFFLAPLLYHLPQPVLAAIVVVSVANLVQVRAFQRAWRAGRADATAAALTFVATLAFAPQIQNGILTGIIVSLAVTLYRHMHPRAIEVGLHADGTLRDTARWGLPPLHPRIAALRFDDSLEFVNVAHFEQAVLRLERERPLAFLLVAAGGINEVDASGIAVVWDLADRLAAKGVTLVFSNVKKQVQDVFDRTGLTAKLGAENLYPTDRIALAALQQRVEGAG